MGLVLFKNYVYIVIIYFLKFYCEVFVYISYGGGGYRYCSDVFSNVVVFSIIDEVFLRDFDDLLLWIRLCKYSVGVGWDVGVVNFYGLEKGDFGSFIGI